MAERATDGVPECLLMPLRDVADHATERGLVLAVIRPGGAHA